MARERIRRVNSLELLEAARAAVMGAAEAVEGASRAVKAAAEALAVRKHGLQSDAVGFVVEEEED